MIRAPLNQTHVSSVSTSTICCFQLKAFALKLHHGRSRFSARHRHEHTGMAWQKRSLNSVEGAFCVHVVSLSKEVIVFPAESYLEGLRYTERGEHILSPVFCGSGPTMFESCCQYHLWLTDTHHSVCIAGLQLSSHAEGLKLQVHHQQQKDCLVCPSNGFWAFSSGQ